MVATEAAVADPEAGVPHPLSRVVADIGWAPEHRSFHSRIAAKKKAEDPAWN